MKDYIWGGTFLLPVIPLKYVFLKLWEIPSDILGKKSYSSHVFLSSTDDTIKIPVHDVCNIILGCVIIISSTQDRLKNKNVFFFFYTPTFSC